jgi:hypothetical protein
LARPVEKPYLNLVAVHGFSRVVTATEQPINDFGCFQAIEPVIVSRQSINGVNDPELWSVFIPLSGQK